MIRQFLGTVQLVVFVVLPLAVGAVLFVATGAAALIPGREELGRRRRTITTTSVPNAPSRGPIREALREGFGRAANHLVLPVRYPHDGLKVHAVRHVWKERDGLVF